MEIINQIGHIQHWGLTPAVNILKQFSFPAQPTRPLRILLSGTNDIRHLLKTLCDINQLPPASRPTLEFYLHETNKELLCRDLLFLHLIHETSLNFDERIQLFLDLYGNAMIKQRNARYLDQLRLDLLNFIHDQKNITTPLKKLVNLKLLKFEDRDDLSEIMQSWSCKVPLDMEKMRDAKLRYLFKERYDYRNNLIDWDYNMLLLQCAPVVHFYHYREWRLTGLAFEQRFSKYSEPNRTLASYAPGKKKQQRTSCLVRGYWGDIIVSPYIAIGAKCDYHQSELLFKKANYKYIGHSVEVAEYNMNYWLYRLEKQQKYTRVFRDYYRADQDTKKKLEERNKQKKKKKEQVNQLGQIKEEEDQHQKQEEQITEKPENKQEQTQEPPKQKPKAQEEGLDSDEEAEKRRIEAINSKELTFEHKEGDLLDGFTSFKTSISLLAMNSDKLIVNKFQQYFDVVCIGFTHSAYLTKGVESILNKGGLLLVEKASYLIPKKKEQRKELNTKLRGLIQQKGIYQEAPQDEPQVFTYFKK